MTETARPMNANATAAALARLPAGDVFNKAAFREAVRSLRPGCSEASINWMLVTLRRQGRLAAAGAGKYYRAPEGAPARKSYRYPHSPEWLELEQTVSAAFPLANFQMWELIQMNDFVNHQIAKNVIFVETEPMLADAVYEALRERHPCAMLQPDAEEFFQRRAPGTDVVVQKLLTEAPTPSAGHSSPIEKLLVDLFSKKLPGQLIERSEYPRIFADAFDKYAIDETRLLRYAKRRHLRDAILSFIKNQTAIRLLTA